MKKTCLAITFLAFISACSQGEIKDKKPIKIGIFVWPGYAHSYIAQEKGFFEKNGVEVELILSDGHTEAIDLYKKGEVDGVFVILPDVVILNSEGIQSKVVYVPTFTISADGIVGKPEFNSLADLKGKKISFEGINSFAHLFVLQALEAEGLKEEDVYFENIPAKDVPKALEEGRIDAGHTWQPFMSKVTEKGYKPLAYSGRWFPLVIVDVLIFNPYIIKERPKDIEAIVRALFEAKDFVYSDNKNEAIKVMAEAEGTSEEEMAFGLNGIRFVDVEENVPLLEKSGKQTSFYASLEVISKFYLERGQLSQIPEFNEIIEPRFVNELIAERQKSK
jgi:NitT/TauT family transport system substrate-binding protein|tara:strand:+ start:708 stop:1709 length:1002 start_codon:yes stop_codon:yes gene_type:complete